MPDHRKLHGALPKLLRRTPRIRMITGIKKFSAFTVQLIGNRIVCLLCGTDGILIMA